MVTLFIILTTLCLLWMVISCMFIVSWLRKQGVKITWIFLKVLIIKYVDQYRRMTKEQTGTPGPWYYSFLFSIWLMAIFAVITIVIKIS